MEMSIQLHITSSSRVHWPIAFAVRENLDSRADHDRDWPGSPKGYRHKESDIGNARDAFDIPWIPPHRRSHGSLPRDVQKAGVSDRLVRRMGWCSLISCVGLSTSPKSRFSDKWRKKPMQLADPYSERKTSGLYRSCSARSGVRSGGRQRGAGRIERFEGSRWRDRGRKLSMGFSWVLARPAQRAR
jgi:hypothetical protein